MDEVRIASLLEGASTLHGRCWMLNTNKTCRIAVGRVFECCLVFVFETCTI